MRFGRVFRFLMILLSLAVLLCAQSTIVKTSASPAAPPAALTPEIKRVLNAITPGNLKGDLSFLASDTLQGRYTPSPGLDAAAEFIASQFRAAGLEPGGNADYFQTAAMVDRRMPPLQSDILLQNDGQSSRIPTFSAVIINANAAVKIDRAAVLVFSSRDPGLITGQQLTGKAVIAPQPAFAKMPRDQAIAAYEKMRSFDTAVQESKAAVEIVVNQKLQPESARLLALDAVQLKAVPQVQVESDELQRWIDHPGKDGAERTVSLDVPAPEDHPTVVKNVIGVLRGSDPQLKNTFVLVTAHYDHIGTTETAGHMAEQPNPTDKSDRIYNGANDDGSGTVSVIEIGRALAALNRHPKRSIVFMTFFGEERGLLGSTYYGRHPMFPIAATVADVNLEQVGRTDATTGRQINTASLTGFDYSDVPKYLINAGRETGIRVYLDKEASDAYFVRSDNAALAEQGVPAHSLTVAFDYPDYHGLGDEWRKIDYDNMARVDRMIALALLRMADSQSPPQWNVHNRKADTFREAQHKLQSH